MAYALFERDSMAYALFENDLKLSRSFPTERDVWRCAEDRGLVTAGVHGEKRLDDNYAIKPLPAGQRRNDFARHRFIRCQQVDLTPPPGGLCSRGVSLQQLAGTRGFYHC